MKICTIFTGGTIGSEFSDNGYISADEGKKYQLIELYQKRYNKNHEFVYRSPYYMLSENLDAKHINLLIREIELALMVGTYDCILVMHGTDTLCYTASALSLLFDDSDIPIILVSADHPLSDERSNGLDNFANAIGFAEYVMAERAKAGDLSKRDQKAHRGVYVSYKNSNIRSATPRIHKGQYVLEQQFMSSAVNSIDDMFYGEFETEGIEGAECGSFRQNPHYKDTFICHTISDLRRRMSKEADEFEGFYLPETCPVLRIFAYPGIIYPPCPADIKYVLIKGYHSGTLCCDEALEDFCARCRMKGITVYIAGLREGESAYESTKKYEELGIKPLFNMTDICAFMFLWFSAGLD